MSAAPDRAHAKAGGQQDAQPRKPFPHRAGEIETGHAAGHDDVAEDEIDFHALVQQGKGRRPAVRLKPAIVETVWPEVPRPPITISPSLQSVEIEAA